MTRSFLGLGSNLGDRLDYLHRAVRLLDESTVSSVVAVSSLYETDPVGGPEQGAFLNIVVQLETTLDARGLLEECRRLETDAERLRKERWGPRTLDVDVLWVDGETVNDPPDLLVPHPRMRERAFVMVPLLELAPDLADGWEDPGTGEVRNLGSFASSAADAVLPGPVTIVGDGRAGRSFASALQQLGVDVRGPLTRTDSLADIAKDPGVVLLCVNDAAVSSVSGQLNPGDAVVAHVAGALTVDAIDARHVRRGGLHPLMALPDAEIGARRLLGGGWVAVAGDPVMEQLAQLLGAQTLQVPDEHRALYHAIAAVAGNHLTALLGQVERLATAAGLPVEPFLDQSLGSLAAVREVGAERALTGPVKRGAIETLSRHLAALPEDEVQTYRALMAETARLAGVAVPFSEGSSGDRETQ